MCTEAEVNEAYAIHAMCCYADGDDAAFPVVYDYLAPRLLYFLRRRRDAEDLMNETFLRIVEARGDFERGACVRAWAFSIAGRLSVDWYRKNVRLVFDEKVYQSVERDLRQNHTPEDALRDRRAHQRLMAVFASFTPLSQRVLELVLVNGLSQREAGAVQGITEMAVTMHVRHARVAFQNALLRGDD